MRDWVIIIDPGCVPDRKGPFLTGRHLKQFLIEAMAGRPYSQILVIGCEGAPSIEDGTNTLEMMDGRSAPTARRHRDRLKSIRRQAPSVPSHKDTAQ